MAYTAQVDGVLVVDKPAGPTSHDIVAGVRKLLKTKTGHLGTLDPAATGVLPLVLGRATRLARFMQVAEKEYRARIRLGRKTDTYDGEGRIVSEQFVPHMTSGQVEGVLGRFRGELNQIPPMYSAVKVGGERLYKAARRGETRQRSERSVTIYRLELLQRDADSWDLEIHCSAGTYVRTLAHDIGEVLGCGAHLEQLRRTRSGDFDLSSAVQYEEISDRWQRVLVPLDQLLSHFPAVVLDSSSARAVSHGNSLSYGRSVEVEYCRLISEDRLIGIAEVRGSLIVPKVVLVDPLRS